MIVPILFAAFGLLAVGCALMVILHKNPVTSALFLVLTFCSLAGLYLLLQAEFLAMVQVIVYAGAIMVLFLFVIMYLNLDRDVDDGVPFVLRRVVGWGVGLLLLVLSGMLLWRGWASGPDSQEPPTAVGNTVAIGQILYSRYLFPFEITSILLIVAIIGAVMLGKGRTMPTGTKDPLP
jgi:NADH-quinone oxidoreductase subunit J